MDCSSHTSWGPRSPAQAVDLDRIPKELGQLALQLYEERRARDRAFLEGHFGEASWDILLDLYARTHRGEEVTITNACIAACVPTTTALRHIERFESEGLIRRWRHQRDGRSWLVGLTDQGLQAVGGCLWGIQAQRRSRRRK